MTEGHDDRGRANIEQMKNRYVDFFNLTISMYNCTYVTEQEEQERHTKYDKQCRLFDVTENSLSWACPSAYVNTKKGIIFRF
jgi:hypothetical protein